jgi:F-type H+-transporting ATPase subunit c
VVKIAKTLGLTVFALMLMAAPAMAQEEAAGATAPAVSAAGMWSLSGAFGAGLVCIGSAYGIGRLAGSALESMARQPEVAGNIQTAMIIAAALIEGFTFFALFICMQQNPWAG